MGSHPNRNSRIGRRRHVVVHGLVHWYQGQKQEKDVPNVLGKDGDRAAVLTQLGEALGTHYNQNDRISANLGMRCVFRYACS